MPTSLIPRQYTFSDDLVTTYSNGPGYSDFVEECCCVNTRQPQHTFCPEHSLSGFPVSLNAHAWDATPGDVTGMGNKCGHPRVGVLLDRAAPQGSTGSQREVQLVSPLLLLSALAVTLSPGWPPSPGSWVTAAGEGTCSSKAYKRHGSRARQRIWTEKSQT